MWNDVRKHRPEKSGRYLVCILFDGSAFSDDESDIIEVKNQENYIVADFDSKTGHFTTTSPDTYHRTKHIITHWAEIPKAIPTKDSDGQPEATEG